MRARGLLLSGCAAGAIACCGGAGSGAGAHAHATPRAAAAVRAAVTVEASAASCAVLTRGQKLAAARFVFSGRFLTGPTVQVDGRDVLVSPARMRVGRNIKGRVPKFVGVVTAVTANGSIAEDGVEAQAGERWLIYTYSRRAPYETSMCGGSRRLLSRTG